MQLEGSSRWLLAAFLGICACGDDGGGSGGGGDAPDASVTEDSGPGDQAAPTTAVRPPPGVYRRGPQITLTADEPATIYYTLDGSEPTTASDSGDSPLAIGPLEHSAELRFFAVDAAGNAEALQSARYDLDRLGPEAVDAFTAIAADSAIELSWTAPTAQGFAEVVIARTSDVAATVPEEGAVYAVGDALGAGEVVYVGSDLDAAEAVTAPGGYVYAAWARYDTGVYSEGRVASATIAPAAQTAELRIDGAAGTAELLTSPADYGVSADNVVYDAGAQTLAVDVTVQSGIVGVVYNLKLLATQVNGGSLESDGSTVAGDWRYFGPEAVAEGGSITRTLRFSGVVDGTVGLQFRLVNTPGFYQVDWGTPAVGAYLFDLATGDDYEALPPAPNFGAPIGDSAFRGVQLTADGRYFIAGSRATPRVVKIDLSSNSVVSGIDPPIQDSTGAVSNGVLDPSGRRYYAVLNDGMHTGISWPDVAGYQARLQHPAEGNDVYLVEIDVATMTEVGRVLLAEGDLTLRGRRIALSRDGRLAAIAVGAPRSTDPQAAIYVVDLSSMRVVDADDARAGVQGFETMGLRPTTTAFSWSGEQVLFNTSTEGANIDVVGVLDLATGEVAVHDMNRNLASGYYRVVSFLPRADGTVWCLGSGDGLRFIDPETGTFSGVGTDPLSVRAALVDGDQLVLAAGDGLYGYDVATGAQLWNAELRSDHMDHHMTLTPFWGAAIGTMPEPK